MFAFSAKQKNATSDSIEAQIRCKACCKANAKSYRKKQGV